MALQKRVSQLPAVSQVVGTDLLIVSSANATKRTTVQQIGAYFQANGVAGPQGPAGTTTWAGITGKPSTFPPSAHQHVIADTTGLQSALDGKQAVGSYATLVGGKVPEAQLPPIVTTWEGLTGKPSTFPPSAHSHAIADVTGLQSALDGKQASGSYAATVHTHGISDVTGLQTALDGKAASSHTHTIANVTGLQSALDAKATPADVTSAVAAVVNAAPASLDTLKELADALGNDANFASTVTNSLAGKVSTSDSRLTDSREWSAATVSQADAEAGTSTDRKAFTPLRVRQAIAAWWQSIQFGTAAIFSTFKAVDGAGTGPGVEVGGDGITFNDSTFQETAFTSAAKTKLNGIASGATANQTDAYLLSRANHTGTQLASTISDFTAAVVAAAPPTTNASLLTSGTLPDARLSANIARTSDVTSAVAAVVNAAPASLDTLKELADALGNDANFASTVTNAIAGKAAAVHTHVIADVTGLQTALDGKQASGSYAAAVHTHGISDVTGLQTALDGKQAAGSYAAASHTHTIANVTGLQTALDGKQAAGSYAAAVHTHGISDVTGLQTALDGKAAATHSHAIADVTGLQTALDGKQAAGSYAAASHGHAIADVSGLQTALDGKAAVSHTHSALSGDITGLATVATSGSAADLTGTLSASRLPSTTVTAGSYGSASSVATYTVDAAGRLTAAGSTAIAISAGAVSGLAAVATSGAYSSLTGTPTTLPPTDGSVTDAKITSGGLSASSINWVAIAPWAANTAYAKGDLVSFQGIAYRRSAAGTSGATFSSSNWQQVTPSEFVGSQITSGTVAAARLGSGTADATTYLRGDSTFAPAVTSVDGSTGAVSVLKAATYNFTRSSKPADATGSNGSYSWTIPSTAKAVFIQVRAGGGGGGSGRRGAAGTARFGGSGGGGGSFSELLIDAGQLTSRSLALTVGAGGAGGAAPTTDDTNGNGGTNGGASYVEYSSGGFVLRTTLGGFAGNAGTSTGANAVGGGLGRDTGGSSGAGQSANNGSDGQAIYTLGAPGGGGGGGVNSSNIAFNGGVGGRPMTVWQNGDAGGGAAGGGSAGNLSTNFPNLITTWAIIANGGGGGGGNASGGGGAGATGALGSGGGGGGGGTNGTTGGAGGNGGDGYIRITVYY